MPWTLEVGEVKWNFPPTAARGIDMHAGHVLVISTCDSARTQLMTQQLVEADLDVFVWHDADGTDWNMLVKASAFIWAYGGGDSPGDNGIAYYGLEAGSLIPVRLVPAGSPPPETTKLKEIDLSDWQGGTSRKFNQLIFALRNIVNRRESRLVGNRMTLTSALPVLSSEEALTSLEDLTLRMRSIGETLLDNEQQVAAVSEVLNEIGKTYRAVDRALRQFLDAASNGKGLDPHSYVALAGGDLADRIHNARGSCGRITTIYRRSGGLRDAVLPRTNPVLMREIDQVFGRLGSADDDLFETMEALGSALTNEARSIRNLLLTEQSQAARERIGLALSRLQPLEEKVMVARRSIQDIQASLGYVDPREAQDEGHNVNTTTIVIKGAVINSQVVVAGKIQDSFNRLEQQRGVSDELKDLLADLHGAVAELTTQLPEKQALLAERDLEDLTKEATADEPSEDWWRRATDGLLEAARKVADVGNPVVELVTKIVTLMGSSSATM